ncbi:MAG: flagellar M-ring protein FliF [Burkholderiaceae bacterium]|nr:flagellar M-ring protein FliF [Burkholderiaceae bacterium]
MFTSSKEWFVQLPRSGRAGFLAGLALIVVLFVCLLYWAFSSSYQVLFTELDPQDGNAIITELERMKVPYRFDEAGKTILVEKDQVYKTRLKLLGKGVNLKGSVGFEIFNESDFGMTDFAQKINYQRALQGEITRTIMGLEEVQSVRVHLVIPETGLLKKGDGQAKASITVANKPGTALTAEQVVGIQRLVAAAIPEIDPSAVTVLDGRGVALSRAVPKSGDKNGENYAPDLEGKLAIKQQSEDYFLRKIVRVLDQTFGPGQAIVSVDVTLNHDRLKITREDVLPGLTARGDPDGAILRKKLSSKITGGMKLSSLRADGAADASGGDRQTTEDVEYQHGKKIEQLVSDPGSIRRLSVGVLLPVNTPPEKIDMLTKVISMAVGLNAARGDAIVVYALKPDGSRTTVQAVPADSLLPASTAASAAMGSDLSRAGGRPGAGADRGVIYIYVLTALLVAVVLAAVVALSARRSRVAVRRLDERERERLLKELQTWLTQEAAPVPGDAAGGRT